SGYANGFTPAYASGAQTTPASYWYGGHGGRSGGYSPYSQGYGYNPYYYSYYPYYGYGYGYQGYSPNSYPQYNATPYPSAGAGGADVALPTLPLGPDGPGGEGTALKKPEPVHHDCFWVGAAYQSVWIKPGRTTIPLATTSTNTGPGSGALGDPGTSV